MASIERVSSTTVTTSARSKTPGRRDRGAQFSRGVSRAPYTKSAANGRSAAPIRRPGEERDRARRIAEGAEVEDQREPGEHEHAAREDDRLTSIAPCDRTCLAKESESGDAE
jgi:hypothetical protein